MFPRRKFSPQLCRAVNHLLRSLPGVRHTIGAPSDPDAATTMEKLDAALNNMSHGLCMFGPDNRLLLWNDRYVKMYRLAPDRLRVGCTLDEMLEARKAAGTAYRDLGQYGSKLRAAITTRSTDNLIGTHARAPVIAEGVETEEQRAFLAREGCQVQGYLIGRPEPIAHYRHLVSGLATACESVTGTR